MRSVLLLSLFGLAPSSVAAPDGPATGSVGLQTLSRAASRFAWHRCEVSCPELRAGGIEPALLFRRAVHRQILDLLRADGLNESGRREAYRLLAVLRPSDQRTVDVVMRDLWWTVDVPQPTESVADPVPVPRSETHPAAVAATRIGLPMVPAVTRVRGELDDAQWLALLWPLVSATGRAAPRIAQDTWGAQALERYSQSLHAGESPPGCWHYVLPREAGPVADMPLADILGSDDPAVRLSVAGDLIARNRRAEQWLTEALMGGRVKNPWTEAPNAWLVDEWPPGEEPPKELSEQARYECIQALGEIRPLNVCAIDALIANIGFYPETYPYTASPAMIALAQIGPEVCGRLDVGMGRKKPLERRPYLDVVGIMLGRYAGAHYEFMLEIHPDWDLMRGDLEYLQTAYRDAPPIYDFIPDAPPEP